MKKILILRDELPDSGHEARLQQYLRGYFKDKALVEIKLFTEPLMELGPGKVKISFGQNEASDYDLIWFRKTSRRYAFLAAALALSFEFRKIKYFDTCFGKRAGGGNKLLNLLQLALGGLPIPLTFFGFKEELAKKQPSLIRALGFPLVAKMMNLHWGGGVFILRNEAELSRFFQNKNLGGEIFLQKFHPHEGDYRILVLGYEVAAWEIMYRQEDLKPGSVGGAKPVGELQKKEFFPVEQIPPAMASLAVRAAKAVNLEVAGVDIFKDAQTGEYFMTEANRTPGLAIDYPGDPELKAVATFLEKELGR